MPSLFREEVKAPEAPSLAFGQRKVPGAPSLAFGQRKAPEVPSRLVIYRYCPGRGMPTGMRGSASGILGPDSSGESG